MTVKDDRPVDPTDPDEPVPAGHFTLSGQGLILEADLAAATLLGLDRGALIDRLLFQYILHRDQRILRRHEKLLLETGEPQVFELRMLRKDGTKFWAQLEATVARDAEVATVLRIVLSDVDERRRAEDEPPTPA
jgi:PAS domain S-box-containing protein